MIESPVMDALPSRHRLRALGQQLGIPVGPRPPGARLIEVVWDGATLIGDADVTIRCGDELLFVESPAPNIEGLRDELRRATTVLGSVFDHAVAVCFALGPDGEWCVHELRDAAPPLAEDGQVLWQWCLRTARPVGLSGADDPLTLRAGVSPEECTWQLGDRPPAGSVLARLQVVAASRKDCLALAQQRLGDLELGGVSHDGSRWQRLFAGTAARRGQWHPSMAVLPEPLGPWVEVLAPGMETTIQDWPGRQGAWEVGVPPSGPMDDRSFRLANRCVGNEEGLPALEILLSGPSLRFAEETVVAVTGAPLALTLNGVPQPLYQALTVPAGGVLHLGAVSERGLRAYLALRGGLRVPAYLGSAATFTLGGFGGHAGRPLVRGDQLWVDSQQPIAAPATIAKAEQPKLSREWQIGVTLGPHAAPDFFTPAGIRQFLDARWTVSARSNRTGVRLDGPSPQWARSDGGEAGLHPSNLHDNGYAIGAVDFTGDTPVILGPDGPSCGGFACPVVIPMGERWKMGQLRPGDTISWCRIDQDQADQLRSQPGGPLRARESEPAVAHQLPPSEHHPGLTLRTVGDGYALLEYGPAELDIALRLRVHLLDQRLRQVKPDGIIDLVPGIRSLLVHVDPQRLSVAALRRVLLDCDASLDDQSARVPTRTLELPLSWDDPSTRKAIEIYQRTVNPDAPWCPWNIEFIRRINGLNSVQEVFDIVYGAEYLVMGLGDVYLGAPVATPIDPRHRLVTTKYNPARTWTPENAVGIGGAYLCIYGMEGPGGYQFVGRTVPVWNTWRSTPCFEPGTPWLLRQFDRIRWYEVSHEELGDLRSDMRSGSYVPRITCGVFDLSEHRQFCAAHSKDIVAAKDRQQQAYNAERQRWAAAAR